MENETIVRYDEIADWYNRVMRTGSLLHDLTLPSLFELIGSVEGKRICDLGCGQGEVARALARRGAAVVGVDVSPRMLEYARKQDVSNTAGIEYVLDDARTLRAVWRCLFRWCRLQFRADGYTGLSPDPSRSTTDRPSGWMVCLFDHPSLLPNAGVQMDHHRGRGNRT